MSTIRVLLVDDHAEFLDAASHFLAADPEIEIVGRALSGHDAVELVGWVHPDLVLIDFALSKRDGIGTTRLLKELRVPPQIIILSLDDDTAYREFAEQAGADGFVGKSEFSAKLLPLIHSLFLKVGKA